MPVFKIVQCVLSLRCIFDGAKMSVFNSWSTAVLLCLVMVDDSLSVDCTNPLPGFRKMVQGVDITKLDLVPLQFQGSSGFMSPVLNVTCNEGRTFTNPRGAQYQLPDQVWQVNTLPGGWLAADVNLYKNFDEVRSSMTREVGGEGSIWKFGFSASRSYSKQQDSIFNSSRLISEVSAFESANRIDMIPTWVIELDRFAAAFIDTRISGTFQSNPLAYNRFIQNFGTHYFSMAQFGGYIRATYETSSSYFYSRSESQTKSNAKASFLKILSAKGVSVSESTNVEGAFTKFSTQTIQYLGGNTNLLSQDNGIPAWQPTVSNDPWLFSGQLLPISDMIVDETKRASMEQAVLNYVLKSYLNELERLVNSVRVRHASPVLTDLQNRISALRNRAVLSENEVESLGLDVLFHVVVPEWFKRSTQLCYNWWADGDGGQCGGGAANRLCALPNSMTPVYRDDTDRRSGGCRMQWGIQSSGYPSWFAEVRVCYRWYADGDRGQCGGGAANELCAGINQFSSEYRDDTDGRSGGCQMSWRLQVPDSAPLWMKTSKMCFSWYPDGDAGQCWAPSRDLCAVANEWTTYYRDDSDERSGGCQLSWGLKFG